MEWEKTFANHVSYKTLIFKICKKLKQLNSKKTTQLKKISKITQQTFLKRRHTYGQQIYKIMLKITSRDI